MGKAGSELILRMSVGVGLDAFFFIYIWGGGGGGGGACAYILQKLAVRARRTKAVLPQIPHFTRCWWDKK